MFGQIRHECKPCDITNLSQIEITGKESTTYNTIKLTEYFHNKFGVKMNGHMSFVYELPRNNTIKVKVVFSDDYVYLRQGNDDKPYNDSLVTIWNKDLTKRDMYVHEWQNWYYLLSGGEELTIKQ